MKELNRREKALIERGYTLKDIENLSFYAADEMKLASDIGFARIIRGVSPVYQPIAIFVGGQPGSGKSMETRRLKDRLMNAVIVNIDMYRSYHPKYLEIEKRIKSHWYDNGMLIRNITDDDTPGNDIADFTHRFVSEISDELIEKAATPILDKYYNIIIEWGMNNPEVPLITMKLLKKKGYTNEVRYVCIHKDISLEACNIRASAIDDDNHIIRKASKSFHQYYIDTLPKAADIMYEKGNEYMILDNMKLVLRDGTIIWDSNIDINKPGKIYELYLNDRSLTNDFINSREIARENNANELKYLKRKKIN